ncbi:hypothetical protein AAMO2058_000911900 [Amorphochlora amoebiformis]
MFTVKTKKSKIPQPISGTLNARSEFAAFWSYQHEDEHSCRELLEQYLIKLYEIAHGKRSSSPGVSIGSVVNTIQFLVFFFGFKTRPKDNIDRLRESILEAINKKRNDSKSDIASLKTKIIQTLNFLDMCSQAKNGSLEPGTKLRRFSNACASHGKTEELQRLRNFAAYPTLDPSVILPGDHCFFYRVMKHECGKKSSALQFVVENIIKRMCAIPQLVKMNPKMAEMALLSYIHMISGVMSLGPRLTSETILELIQTMYQFFFWPHPIGSIAEALLLRLEREYILPGYTIREALSLEGACARVKACSGPVNQRESLVFHITDVTCPQTLTFCHIMRLNEKEEKSKGGPRLKVGQLSSQVKLAMIVSVMSADVKLSKGELAKLAKVNSDDLKSVLDECNKVVEALEQKLSKGMKPADVIQIRTERLTAIKDKWSKLALKTEDNEEPVCLDMKEVDLASIIDGSLSLPQLSHEAIQDDLTYTLITPEQRKLTYEKFLLPPEPIMYESLVDKVKKTMYGLSPGKKLTIRMALMGGDKLMHSFLCAYIRLLFSDKKIENLRFQMFVIPTSLNRLSAYIARQDSWYKNHIYTPFWSKHFLLPWTHIDAYEKDVDPLDEPLEMSNFFLDLVNSYVREAKQTLNLKVWKCNVFENSATWELKSDKRDSKRKGVVSSEMLVQSAISEEATQVLPFFQRLEIGYRVELLRYCETEELKLKNQVKKLSRRQLNQQEQNEYMMLRAELRLENKAIRWKKYETLFAKERTTLPEIKLRFVNADLEGKPIKVVCDAKHMVFTQLVLSNVPHYGDDGFPSDPEKPWLELYSKAAPSHSTKKSTLNAEPCQHVSRVELTVRGNEKFSVLVDGRLFPKPGDSGKGYKSLVVEKMMDPDSSKQLVFPVQTFFPANA